MRCETSSLSTGSSYIFKGSEKKHLLNVLNEFKVNNKDTNGVGSVFFNKVAGCCKLKSLLKRPAGQALSCKACDFFKTAIM